MAAVPAVGVNRINLHMHAIFDSDVLHSIGPHGISGSLLVWAAWTNMSDQGISSISHA